MYYVIINIAEREEGRCFKKRDQNVFAGLKMCALLAVCSYILYNQNYMYWQSSNLVVWSQNRALKILAEFKFGGSVLRHHKHCMRAFIWECCCPLI